MAIFLSKPYAYTKMEMEDAEEINHRRAQFLIYRTLEKSDSSKRRPSWTLRVRVSKLKIKIGRRMKRLKKSLFLSMSAPKGGGVHIHKHVISQLTIWKRFFRVREAAVSLPPLLCSPEFHVHLV